MTLVKNCPTCSKEQKKHEFQDQQYGPYVRVFNLSEDKKKSKCTICGNKAEVKQATQDGK